MAGMNLRVSQGVRAWIGIRPWTRHSLVLLVAGLAYILIGISYVYVSEGDSRWRSLTIARDWFPLNFWAAIFIVVGLGAVISSRWPPMADTWGYSILTGLSTLWGGFYMAGVLSDRIDEANLSGAFVWWLVAFLWWAISGLVNPEKVIVVINHGQE